MTVTPIAEAFGATVTGVDLRHLTDDEWTGLYAAFLEFAVLVLPAQHLSSQEQVTFARRFGEIEPVGRSVDEAAPISNLDAPGNLVSDPAAYRAMILKGNEEWHTDSSYRPVSSKASMLSAHVLPDSGGGETEWADMRAAYAALEPELRERVEGLSAYHSYVQSQSKVGHTLDSDHYLANESDPLRPLVKRHPETGVPALFIGRHAYAIAGLDRTESDALLDQLLEFAVQPHRVYQHRWAVGDLLIWDNRCTLHRARPWDLSQERTMVHTRIFGDSVTEAAA